LQKHGDAHRGLAVEIGERVVADRAAPPGPVERRTMLPKSSGSTSRPRAVTVYTSDCPGGAGSAPIFPAAYWLFCVAIACATSVVVTPSCDIFAGLSHTRIE
jgi:hypothetical protein